jgi:hypothetical protein
VPKDPRITDDTGPSSVLERFGFADLVALRKELEEALALARAGVPIPLPPLAVKMAVTNTNEGTGEPGDG